MDFASFGIAGVACITVICYLAATAVKQTFPRRKTCFCSAAHH